MINKKVKQIIGGVVIVVICGATFLFMRGNTSTSEQESVEQTSDFRDEDTKTDTANV